MSDLKLVHKGGIINGEIVLGGSKSITNRAYIIRALCNNYFEINNASQSDDSKSLLRLLNQKEGVLDAGHAGTTFRFLTAFFAFQPGNQLLTGSERMQQRPIGPLVEALRQLGANIHYVNKEGYPPIQINEPVKMANAKVSVPGDVSSQFISALLLVAPSLDDGLEINFTGELVSAPYLQMTLDIMRQFGVMSEWQGNTIVVHKQDYQSHEVRVEADWSSASYYFSMAALATEAAITLKGLFVPSLQGDSAIAEIARSFGVATEIIDEDTILVTKEKDTPVQPLLEYDFLRQPDIAQTVFGMCAGKGVSGLFTGLQTLKIKETDRIRAMQTELAKTGVFLSLVPNKFHSKDPREMYMIEGYSHSDVTPVFDTYHDHRMAMSLAPLSLLMPIVIRDVEVVSKSYPSFWQDLKRLGFEVSPA